ncbi:MAG: hypothetical protein PHD67_03810 [Oscillospiraceae bacterium]|nr:hypothetical protein [Oscillospiraceae bacterium]
MGIYNNARMLYLFSHTLEDFQSKNLSATFNLNVTVDPATVGAADADKIVDTAAIKSALVSANPDCSDFVTLFDVTSASWNEATGAWTTVLSLSDVSLAVLDPIIQDSAPNIVNFSMPAEILEVKNFTADESFSASFHMTGSLTVAPFTNAMINAMLPFTFDETASDVSIDMVAPVSVTISPSSATLAPGGTTTFQATVTNDSTPARGVTYSFADDSNETAGGSTIDAATGVLTIGENETAESLSVKATSARDPNKSATAAVTVRSSDPTSVDLTFTGSPIIGNTVSHELNKNGTKKFT